MTHKEAPTAPWRRLATFTCALLWLGAFLASHVPPARAPDLGAEDKTLHAVGFFALTTAFWLALFVRGWAGPRRVAVALVTMAAYAAFDEITQPLVGRYAEWSDWLADVVGSTVAVSAAEMFLVLRRRLRRGA